MPDREKSRFKKLDTSGHFTDFWHRAKTWRDSKKIRARKERKMLNGAAKDRWKDDA